MIEEKRGQFLKDLRKAKKMTQEELGELLHYSNKAISKWERGFAFPHDPSTLEKLAKIFEVSEIELLYGEKKTKQNEEKMNKNITAIYKKNYKKLTLSIIITIIMTSLVILLSCVLFYSYFIKGKIRCYTLQGESSLFTVNTSNILLTNDKSFFNFSGVKEKSEAKVNHITLYYYDAKEKKDIVIFSGANDNYYFSIPKGYNEIDLEKVVSSKIFIEVWYNGTEKETFELQIKEEYKNEKLFFKEEITASEDLTGKDNKSFVEFLVKEGFSYNENSFSKQEEDVQIKYIEPDGFIISKASQGKIEVISCSLSFDEALYFLTINKEKTNEKILLEGEFNPNENKEDFKTYYIKYLNYLKRNYTNSQQ